MVIENWIISALEEVVSGNTKMNITAAITIAIKTPTVHFNQVFDCSWCSDDSLLKTCEWRETPTFAAASSALFKVSSSWVRYSSPFFSVSFVFKVFSSEFYDSSNEN